MKLPPIIVTSFVSLVAIVPAVRAEPDPSDDGSTKAATEATDQSARELYLRGDRLYAEGDYEGAVEAFEQAYQLSQRTGLLYNLANTYERLGRHEEALRALRAFVPEAGELADAAQKRINNLERRLEERRLDKRRAAERRLEEQRQKERAVEEDLFDGHLQNEPATAASAVAIQRHAERMLEGGGENTPPEPNSAEFGVMPGVGTALLGLGAVGIGVGVGFAVDAMAARDEAAALCPESSGGSFCTPSAQDALDRDTSSSLIADVSLGVGIAAAATGLTLVLVGVTSADDSGTDSTRLSIRPRSGGGEVSFVTRF